MYARLFVACLLLGPAATAQTQDPTSTQQLLPPAVTAQEPASTQQAPEAALRELTAERERLAREIAYVRDRLKDSKAVLGKLGKTERSHRAIDAGRNAPLAMPQPPMLPPKPARVGSSDEMSNQPAGTVMLVNGIPVTQAAVDELMAHVGAPATDKMAMQRCLLELIRIEAVATAFGDSDAQGRIAEVIAQLDAGKPIAEVAKSFGVVPRSSPDGRFEVIRYGNPSLRFEQVAFSTEVGKRSAPFRMPFGIAVLQVDKVEKGATPALDKVSGTAVMVPWGPDEIAMQRAMSTGQLDILVRDEQVLAAMPPPYGAGVQAPVALPGAGDDVEPSPIPAMLQRLEQLNAEIQKLQGKTDEASQAQLKALQSEHQKLKEAIAAAGGKGNEEPPAPKKN